jgi:hypothetical protein
VAPHQIRLPRPYFPNDIVAGFHRRKKLPVMIRHNRRGFHSQAARGFFRFQPANFRQRWTRMNVVPGFAIRKRHKLHGVSRLQELGRGSPKLDFAIVGMCSETDDPHGAIAMVGWRAPLCPVHNGCPPCYAMFATGSNGRIIRMLE